MSLKMPDRGPTSIYMVLVLTKEDRYFVAREGEQAGNEDLSHPLITVVIR